MALGRGHEIAAAGWRKGGAAAQSRVRALLIEIAPEQAAALGLTQAAFPRATTWVAADAAGRARCVGVEAEAR